MIDPDGLPQLDRTDASLLGGSTSGTKVSEVDARIAETSPATTRATNTMVAAPVMRTTGAGCPTPIANATDTSVTAQYPKKSLSAFTA